MVFIRTKRIKKAQYAYLVENVWTSKGSRQKIKSYLGRIIELKYKDENDEYELEESGEEKELIKEDKVSDNIKEDEVKEKKTEFERYIGINLKEFIKDNDIEEIVRKMVEYETVKAGFEKSQEEKNVMMWGNIFINLKTFKTYVKRKHGSVGDVVLKSHEGFICKESVKELLKYNPMGEDEREDAIMLAKLFVEAGLKVEKEIFIEVFAKVVKKGR